MRVFRGIGFVYQNIDQTSLFHGCPPITSPILALFQCGPQEWLQMEPHRPEDHQKEGKQM